MYKFYFNAKSHFGFTSSKKMFTTFINYDWLAGLIDGCGSFVCKSKKDASLSLIVPCADLLIIRMVKKHFGGQIKARAGGHSFRYTLGHNPAPHLAVSSTPPVGLCSKGFASPLASCFFEATSKGSARLRAKARGEERWGGAKGQKDTRSKDCKRYWEKGGLLLLIHFIKYRLWNTTKQKELMHLCQVLGIPMGKPNQPDAWNSAYAAGLFDGAGGAILYVLSHKAPTNMAGLDGKIARLTKATSVRLIINVKQSYMHNLTSLTISYYNGQTMGNLYYQTARQNSYAWEIQYPSETDAFLRYLETYPCYGIVGHRLSLINTYHKLIDAGALKTSNARLAKQWANFAIRWYLYEKV
jgi:hypothetical protein